MAASSRFEVLLQRGSTISTGATLLPGPEHIAYDQRRRPDHPNDEHKNISAALASAAFGHRTLQSVYPKNSRTGMPRREPPDPTGHREALGATQGGHATPRRPPGYRPVLS